MVSVMVSSEEQKGVLISFDFETSFPYMTWVSTWSSDESYPDGFRYKILSSWTPEKDSVVSVLVLQEGDYSKTEMKRWQGTTEATQKHLSLFISGLEEEYNIDFEKQDFSKVRTEEEFEEIVSEYGWN